MGGKLNVIVCGTTFGEYYLKALKKSEQTFHVAGILGKGSERSKILARKYGVPLYCDVKELPKDIDMACVIVRSEGVGGEGTDLCRKLLNRGIHVVQEQPVYQRHLQECYRLAKDKKLLYMTANLYSHLDNIKTFISTAKTLNKLSRLEYINASFATQVSYTSFDILIDAGITGTIDLNKEVIKRLGPFDIIHGKIGKVPVLLEFNNKINPHFPDYNMYVMHHFRFYYDDGILSLEDTFGPVTWRPRIYIQPTDTNMGVSNENTYHVIGEPCRKGVYEVFETSWIDAIVGELALAKSYIEQGNLDSHRVNRELNASKNWETLYDVTGYAEFTNDYKRDYLRWNDIQKNIR